MVMDHTHHGQMGQMGKWRDLQIDSIIQRGDDENSTEFQAHLVGCPLGHSSGISRHMCLPNFSFGFFCYSPKIMQSKGWHVGR